MARTSKINYWTSRGAFGTVVKGKQHILAVGPDDRPDGETFRAAEQAFKRLRWGEVFGPTYLQVGEAFLAWYDATHPAKSALTVRKSLQRALAQFGNQHVSQVTGPTIEKWAHEARSGKGWSNSTVRQTLTVMRQALRWAVDEGMVKALPFTRLRMPRAESRGKEVVLTPEQEQTVFAVVSGPLRDLAIILRDTGCRPGEASAVEARHWDPHLRALVLPAHARQGPSHKTGAKTGRDRIIYLRGEALAVVLRLIDLYPDGPLFRSRARRVNGPNAGKRWAWTEDGINSAFRRLRRKVGLPHLLPYSFRHTWAVRRLREGWSVDVVATALGTSRRMVEEHYGHLAEQTDFIRALVDGIGGEVKR